MRQSPTPARWWNASKVRPYSERAAVAVSAPAEAVRTAPCRPGLPGRSHADNVAFLLAGPELRNHAECRLDLVDPALTEPPLIPALHLNPPGEVGRHVGATEMDAVSPGQVGERDARPQAATRRCLRGVYRNDRPGRDTRSRQAVARQTPRVIPAGEAVTNNTTGAPRSPASKTLSRFPSTSTSRSRTPLPLHNSGRPTLTKPSNCGT